MEHDEYDEEMGISFFLFESPHIYQLLNLYALVQGKELRFIFRLNKQTHFILINHSPLTHMCAHT
jgi:hypothetical protein